MFLACFISLASYKNVIQYISRVVFYLTFVCLLVFCLFVKIEPNRTGSPWALGPQGPGSPEAVLGQWVPWPMGPQRPRSMAPWVPRGPPWDPKVPMGGPRDPMGGPRVRMGGGPRDPMGGPGGCFPIRIRMFSYDILDVSPYFL